MESERVGESIAVAERSVFVPWNGTGLCQDRSEADPANVDAIFIRSPDGAPVEQSIAVARRVLEDPHAFSGKASWVTPDVVLAGVRRFQATVSLTLGSIAVLCVLLGGTTLMSLMVANVRDRVPEIGLRRALGATPRDVGLLFLVEGCLVTGAAALISTVAGHLVLWLGLPHLRLPMRLTAWTFFIPLATAVVVGCLFSYLPARLAARISPADALRSE